MSTKLAIDYQALHHGAIVIDTHCDALGQVLEGTRRLGEQCDSGQFDIPRALAGGLTAELMAVFSDTERPETGAVQTLQYIDIFHEEIAAVSNLAIQATHADDIVQAKKLGKIALVLSMEGAEGLEGDISVLRIAYRLGLRVLGFTWDLRNRAADGVGESRTGGGLTNFGEKLVNECNRLGIVIDLAHLSPQGVQDVLGITTAPVVATHANSHALCNHPRNLSDKQLEEIAKTGGVVGVTAVPPFLDGNTQRSDISALLDHIEHIVSIMGEDGVGLGMDFDGVGAMRVVGIDDVSKLSNITRGLVERGYKADAIIKILGANFLRVFATVW